MMMVIYLLLALMFIGAVFPSNRSGGRAKHSKYPSHYVGETISGQVRRVVDGDGFTMVVDGTGEKIMLRLSEIDAPEHGQPLGGMATSMLRSLVLRKAVTVVASKVGPYGRLIGRVYVRTPEGVIDVNAWLVSHGLAWVYRRYTKDKVLLRLEREARAQGLGVWSLPENLQVAPWDWRKMNPRHN